MKKKRNNVIVRLILLFVISVAIGFCINPIFKNLKYGLDLQGGFEVLYQIDSIDGSKVTKSMVTNTYKTISKRIDVLGVSEPNISIEGDNKIRIQLAGITDPEEARNLLSTAANLTFRDTSDNLLMNSDVLRSGGAKITQDEKGNPAVSLSIRDKEKFYDVTKKVSEMDDNRIVIWLDYDEASDSFANEAVRCGSLTNSKCLSSATVSQGFASDVIIQGNFTSEEVSNLVDLINSGSLPTKLSEISSKTVGASFGANSLNLTLTAGLIGIGLVILFMIAVYRFAGLIASFGIIIYTFLTFLIFWLIGGVLTLPGIAAIVIGIGMAVDANVISFSRIKDELKKGTGLSQAYKNGNKNSFMTIFDSNLTTLIVAVILFIFGESSIKGFATVLIISIFTTMIVMVGITRYLLTKFVNTKYFDKKLNLFIGINEKNIPDISKNEKNDKEPFAKLDFAKNRKWFYLTSIVLISIGIVSLFVSGLNLGIDFKGGSSVTLKTDKKVTVEDIKKDIKELKYESSDIEISDGLVIMTLNNELSKDEVLKTEKFFNEKYSGSTDIGVVSNIVKKELVKNAFLSLIIAAIAIIIYISIRFRFSYAVGAILALLNDVLIIIGVFSLLKLEVTTIFIAAILSIIGYSINDTIVTFDRIRENTRKLKKNRYESIDQIKSILNTSIRQTLTRSIITTITTLLPVIALIIFGSHEIINFNIALLIGLISGVYSSICLASPIWLDIEKRSIGKEIKKKWYEDDEKEVEELKVRGINS